MENKTMKKITAILLSAAMILSLTVTTAAQNYSIDTALTILKHLAALEIIEPDQQAQYDFDGDGIITINDTLEVLKLLAGLPNLIDNVSCRICDRNVIACPGCGYCVDCDPFERCDTYPAYGVDCCPCPAGTHLDDWDFDWGWDLDLDWIWDWDWDFCYWCGNFYLNCACTDFDWFW
jgi:hypothetical protein